MRILNDIEHRIFLAAMAREEKVCKKVMDEDPAPKDTDKDIVAVCHSIERKVDAAISLEQFNGLDEGIRCAMCTNHMKSDRGCDGNCIVNEDMYHKVMDTIYKQFNIKN